MDICPDTTMHQDSATHSLQPDLSKLKQEDNLGTGASGTVVQVCYKSRTYALKTLNTTALNTTNVSFHVLRTGKSIYGTLKRGRVIFSRFNCTMLSLTLPWCQECKARQVAVTEMLAHSR